MALDTFIVDLARELILVVLVISGPIMGIGLIVGVSVSLFQALTSVQEQTLSMVPKMLAVMGATLLILAPALQYLGNYTARILNTLPEFGLQ